jgi:hypothetical protein
MKLRSLVLSFAGLALGATLWAFQQEGEQMGPPPEPSAEHKLLHDWVGTWDATIHIAEPPSKGTMVVELGPGGYTVQSEFTGDMGPMGTFHGRGMDGYDQFKKKYVSIWTDSTAPVIMTFEGTWDASTKSMTSYGDMLGPKGMAKSKLVNKWIDKDNVEFTMTPVDAPDQVFKIVYKRKK